MAEPRRLSCEALLAMGVEASWLEVEVLVESAAIAGLIEPRCPKIFDGNLAERSKAPDSRCSNLACAETGCILVSQEACVRIAQLSSTVLFLADPSRSFLSLFHFLFLSSLVYRSFPLGLFFFFFHFVFSQLVRGELTTRIASFPYSGGGTNPFEACKWADSCPGPAPGT